MPEKQRITPSSEMQWRIWSGISLNPSYREQISGFRQFRRSKSDRLLGGPITNVPPCPLPSLIARAVPPWAATRYRTNRLSTSALRIVLGRRLQLRIPECLLLSPGKENRIGIQLREVSRMRLYLIDDSLQSNEGGSSSG
jgi:hypothetical protein